MPDYVHLLGTEDVQRAGYAMREAAESISRAAASMEDSLLRHRLWMDDWLMRFETALRERGEVG